MRSWAQSTVLLLAMQVLVPLVPVAIANGLRLLNAHGLEPLADNLLSYGLVFVLLLPASLAVGVYHSWKGPALSEPFEDTFRYAAAGGAGAAALIALADIADDYFSGPGISLVYVAVGFFVGGLFGAAFRGASGLLTGHMRR